MEGKDEQGKFISGHPGFKKLGTKNKTTLLKEERRAIFDEEVSQMWRETIKKMKPEYIGDQFIGKAAETVDHKINFLFDADKETTT